MRTDLRHINAVHKHTYASSWRHYVRIIIIMRIIEHLKYEICSQYSHNKQDCRKNHSSYFVVIK